jgi:Protein of unknown function (DUF1257)
MPVQGSVRQSMSHFSRIRTKFRHREALVECLQGLGYHVETDTTVKGYHGQHNVDIAARKSAGYGIGFVKNPDGTYDMVADLWGAGSRTRDTMAGELDAQSGIIQKAYAKKMVLEQARSDGFDVVSQVEEKDGTLRIVVRRWQ